jgi:HlyD family secretion protein
MLATLTLKLEQRLPFLKGPRKIAYGIALILVLGGAGIAYDVLVYKPAQVPAESTLQTAVVRQGDLTISATGSGTLTAPEETLGFTGSGDLTVTGVYVKAGDLVRAGDLLADVDSRQTQLNYADAKRAYLDLTSPAAVARAQRAMANAQASLDSARYQLEYLISPDVYYWETELEKDQSALKKAQHRLDQSPSDANAQQTLKAAQGYVDFAQDKLKAAWKDYWEEYVPETFPIGIDGDTDTYLVPTDLELEQARTAIGDARTKLKEGEDLYNVLTGAPMPEDTLNSSLIAVKQAQRRYEDAKATLDGSKIVAPFDGTVMQVNAAGGDTAALNSKDKDKINAASIVVLADTNHPFLEVYWDESDWSLLKVGASVDITFDDLPDQVFSGKITEVDRELTTSGSSTVVRGEVSLDTSFADLHLPIGASASAEAISQRAQNAIYIPREALHETSPGNYAVFVLTDGKPRVRTVQVSLQNELYAVVTSGLQAGDVVTTGVVKTQ